MSSDPAPFTFTIGSDDPRGVPADVIVNLLKAIGVPYPDATVGATSDRSGFAVTVNRPGVEEPDWYTPDDWVEPDGFDTHMKPGPQGRLGMSIGQEAQAVLGSWAHALLEDVPGAENYVEFTFRTGKGSFVVYAARSRQQTPHTILGEAKGLLEQITALHSPVDGVCQVCRVDAPCRTVEVATRVLPEPLPQP